MGQCLSEAFKGTPEAAWAEISYTGSFKPRRQHEQPEVAGGPDVA